MFVFLAVLLIWVFSLCLHEYAHARVAFQGGDFTVAQKGYLDFNPARYLDPINSIVIPLVFLLLGGLALPGGAVWIDRTRLRSRAWETGVSLAGPAANLALALACAAPFILGVANEDSPHPAWAILAFCAYLQVSAALLNLVPVPGLDGYGALEPWLPWSVRDALAPFRRYAMFVLLALFMGTPFGSWFATGVISVLDGLGIPGEQLRAGYKAFFFWRKY
jgi:Zn-dependent protease